MRPVQYFSDEYLDQCKKMTPKQILEFLESFRSLNNMEEKTKLISIKIPESMLKAFRAKCELEGVKYQTQIKSLMKEWLG